MNRFCRFLAGLMAMVFAQTLLATDLQVDLSYFNLSKATNRTVYGYLQTVPNISGSSVVIGQRVIYTSDSSGIFYVSNCVAPGLYRFDVQAPPVASSFLVYISATNLGLISAASNLAVSGSATYPPGAVAWSASTTDSRYVKIPTNNATASDGQVVSKTGDQTKWVTGGGAGSQTPWEQNVSGAGYSLSNVLSIQATNFYGVTTNSIPGLTVALAQKDGTNSQIGISRINSTSILDTRVLFNNNGGVDGYSSEDLLAFIGGIPISSLSQSGATSNQVIQWNGSAWSAASVSGGGTTYTNNPTGLPGVIVGAGIGTNFSNIHVASATDAAFATEATRAHGLLDLDSLDAVTTTLTKIVATSGHDYLGGGSGLTNIPTLWVASISALTNLPNVADGVVGYVDSYFGTNVWGGGAFKRSTGSSATIDNGTVFAASGSGRWLRVDTGYPTNVFLMEWFGVVPNAAINQYTGIQAAINATPSTAGACITPPYGIATATTLTWTNRRGCYFGALGSYKTETPGYRVFPNPTSVIHWMGANGGTNLVAYDVGHCTFAGFGLDTRIGLNNGDQYTNAAGLLMDVDMNSTHSTTTSANVFDGMYFRERHTNTTLVGLRIAYSNWQNCEFFRLRDCYFQGSGANIPDYWVSVTNTGASKAIQLGGGGGGGNSFGHKMVNCGFSSWQYNLHSLSGSWDIENNYGTAAGVAAYYLNGTHPSYIRSTQDEGDRQFLVSPSVNPVILEGNRFAWSATSVSNIAQIDAIKVIMIGNYWNTDASGSMPAVTNSFNATGWYYGIGNLMPNVYPTNVASWRFRSGFESKGDFSTVNDLSNIQTLPIRTVSPLTQTNPVWAAWTDSATFPVLTLMPSNGAVAIGGYINNVLFSVWNADALNRVPWQVGDQYETIRARLMPVSTGSRTQFELNSDYATYLLLRSTNTEMALISGFNRNSINFVTNYGEITVGPSATQVATFGTSGVTFPADTNFSVTGPAQFNSLGATQANVGQLRATNYISLFTNGFAGLPATPTRYGQIAIVNTNATLVAVAATTSGSLAWGSTNVLPTTAAQIVGKFTGTPTGSLFLRDDGTLAAPSVGGVAWGAISGTLSSQTDLQNALDAKVSLAIGTTNNNTLLGGSFVMTGNGSRGITNLAIGSGLVVENGVLKTNGQTIGGGSQTPWTSDIDGANYKLTNLNYASFSGGVVLDKDGARNNGYVSSVVTAIGGRSNLIQGSASSVDNVVLEGRSNVFNIQSSVAVGNAIIAGSSNLLNNPALATVRNSVILGGHGNNIQGASDALVAGSGSVVQSGHNGTFILSDSQNTATLSQSSNTLLLRFQNGVGINTNNPGTNALFVLGSQTVSSNLSVGGTITGNGSGITNLQFAPTAISLGGTNAAMLSNMVSTLIVSTNVLFTNWPAMAVAGYWGRTILTNSQPNNELIYVPTNMMPHNLTNSVGCYVVLDNTGTNWACTLTNLRTAELVWSAWGGNVNSMHAYFRHW